MGIKRKEVKRKGSGWKSVQGIEGDFAPVYDKIMFVNGDQVNVN